MASLVIIFYYLYYSEKEFTRNIIKEIYVIGIINIVFNLLEIILKKYGISNLDLIPYSLYINDRKELGGIFYQPSLNSLFLNTTALLSLYYRFKGCKKTIYKMLFIALYIIAISLSIYTSTRAAMVSMCFAMVIFFIIATYKHFGRLYRRNMAILFSIYLLLIILNTTVLALGPIEKFHVLGSEDFSILSRLNIWFAQILIFFDYPIFGVGLDNFKYINMPYQLESIRILKLPFDAIGNFTYSHNEFLQLLSEGGLFLIIPLLYLFYIALMRIGKKLDEKNILFFAILIIFLVHSMFSWELRHPALMFTFVLIVAYLLKEESAAVNQQKLKWPLYIGPLIFIIIYLTFFCTYGKALAHEFYYLKKAKNEKNFFISLTYIDKLSRDPFLSYGADHLFVQKSFYFMCYDIFKSNYIPLTKDLFEKVDKAKLFNYDKMAFVNLTEEKAKYLYKLRPFWFYPHAIALCELIKGNYESAYNYSKKAERLKPGDDAVFALMHFANILKASEIKGVDVEELLPTKEELKTLLKGLKKQLK